MLTLLLKQRQHQRQIRPLATRPPAIISFHNRYRAPEPAPHFEEPEPMHVYEYEDDNVVAEAMNDDDVVVEAVIVNDGLPDGALVIDVDADEPSVVDVNMVDVHDGKSEVSTVDVDAVISILQALNCLQAVNNSMLGELKEEE